MGLQHGMVKYNKEKTVNKSVKQTVGKRRRSLTRCKKSRNCSKTGRNTAIRDKQLYQTTWGKRIQQWRENTRSDRMQQGTAGCNKAGQDVNALLGFWTFPDEVRGFCRGKCSGEDVGARTVTLSHLYIICFMIFFP